MFARLLKTSIRRFSVDKTGSHKDFHSVSVENIYNPIEFIEDILTKNKVVLFMKGNPEAPQCGFSNYAVQALKHYNVKDYFYVNILENQVLREEVKKYSDWPTYPQLYINKEFVGGCDIIAEMHKNNTFLELLEKNQVVSKE